MYEEIISRLVEGMAVLVDSNSMQKKLLPDSIAWAEYEKNYKGFKYNHIGGAHQDMSGQWWVSEEKRLLSGVASTSIEEYLAKDYNLLFRAPNKPMTEKQIAHIDFMIQKYSGNFRYRWGGLFTELWQQLTCKIWKKNKEVNYKSKDGIWICSEWYGVLIGREDFKGKSPKDWQEDSQLHDVMLWIGKAQKLIVF